MPQAVVVVGQASISRCRIAETVKPAHRLAMDTKSVTSIANERPLLAVVM